MTSVEVHAQSAGVTQSATEIAFDPDAPLPDLHIPVRGLGIETVEEDDED